MTSFELSIVTPTHGRKALLQDMLASLRQQTLGPERFEVVVVIDGDTDSTAEMLSCVTFPYKLRHQTQGQSGPAAARNRGAQLAEGRVLLFLDDDLIVRPECLEEHLRFHRLGSDAVVIGRLLAARGDKKPGWSVWEERVLEKHYAKMAVGRRPAAGRRLYSGNFSVSRARFLRVRGFDESLMRGEDVELGFRLEQSGARFYFAPSAAVVHRGVRTFSSWCNSAYLYGVTDVALALERGHTDVLPEVLRWYHRQPAVTRMAVKLCAGRPALRNPAVRALQAVAAGFFKARAHKLAHFAYSSIYKLQYWEGVAERLGGRAQLMRAVSESHRKPNLVKNPR